MATQLSDADFDFIYARVPRACVDIVIETDQGLVLIKREDPPDIGVWHLPGGGVRFQETVEEAAKRIAQRELGVEIELGQVIGFDEYLHEQKRLGEAHSIAMMVKAKIVEGSLDELIKSGQVAIFKDLPENIMKPHKVALEKYQKTALSSGF